MSRTIVVCGYGSGISDAVARKFGAEGFQVALVGRNVERGRAGAQALEALGVTAKAFACDLSDAAEVRSMIAQVQSTLGPITVLHWNAYATGAADLTTCDPFELRGVFDLSVTNIVVALQAALPDFKQQENPAILVTSGGLAYQVPEVDAMAVSWGAMGLAIGKSAQRKLVGVLHHRLAPEGIHVGEVVVMGAVKGTAFDHGNATLEASTIATRFWSMYTERGPASVEIKG